VEATSGMINDPFDLNRFVRAQDSVYQEVFAELKHGRKEGHWMWFIFPQLRGLGSSSMAHKFGISSQAEAEAYLAHPILGPRLVECTAVVNTIEDRSIEQVFGLVDSVKFRSCMTLFAEVAHEQTTFADALHKYFGGQKDPLTLERLR
jgi:uncharacterized protein (DUF1810 family)